jgi:hypothetical protein
MDTTHNTIVGMVLKLQREAIYASSNGAGGGAVSTRTVATARLVTDRDGMQRYVVTFAGSKTFYSLHFRHGRPVSATRPKARFEVVS